MCPGGPAAAVPDCVPMVRWPDHRHDGNRRCPWNSGLAGPLRDGGSRRIPRKGGCRAYRTEASAGSVQSGAAASRADGDGRGHADPSGQLPLGRRHPLTPRPATDRHGEATFLAAPVLLVGLDRGVSPGPASTTPGPVLALEVASVMSPRERQLLAVIERDLNRDRRLARRFGAQYGRPARWTGSGTLVTAAILLFLLGATAATVAVAADLPALRWVYTPAWSTGLYCALRCIRLGRPGRGASRPGGGG
uniref:DUF3040 domain-containing protein n=1 Tax=Kitasatospora indigofera TaxID=67307 RepID=UPI0038D0B37F